MVIFQQQFQAMEQVLLDHLILQQEVQDQEQVAVEQMVQLALEKQQLVQQVHQDQVAVAQVDQWLLQVITTTTMTIQLM